MNDFITAKDVEEENGFGVCRVNKQNMKVNLVQKEEAENEQPKRSFETIFLPDVYEGIAVETPFFDINQYKVKCGLPTEDCEIRTNINCPNVNSSYLPSNTRSNSNQPFSSKTEGHQIKNEKAHFLPSVSNSLPSPYANRINSVIQDTEHNRGVPINNIHINLNFYHQTPQGYYINTHTGGYVYQNSNVSVQYKNINPSYVPKYRKIRPMTVDPEIIDVDKDVEIVLAENKDCSASQKKKKLPSADKKHVQRGASLNNHSDSNFNKIKKDAYVSQSKTITPQVTNKYPTPYRRTLSKNRGKNAFYCTNENLKDVEDDKYKCSICKRPRVFSTVTALNNHLKFEHISMFNEESKKESA